MDKTCNLCVSNKLKVFDGSREIRFQNYCVQFNCDPQLYKTFQGFVLFDEWGTDACPLESISRVNPFRFEDDTQIIYLQSTYYANSTRKHPCLWQFTAPKGYGFKYIVEALNVVSPVQLSIKNSTEILKK